MYTFVLTVTTLISLFTTSHSQSIDPSTVPISTRNQWCSSQVAQCPLICTQTNKGSAATDANDCDPTTLSFDCICGDGISPNASEYSQTIPYYICTQYNTNCQNNCGGNSACQAACVQNHPCGAQDPTRINATTTTMSSTAGSTVSATAKSSASDGIVYTGFGGASATASAATGSSSSSKSGAVRMIAAGEAYGLGVVVVGMFAGFALLL